MNNLINIVLEGNYIEANFNRIKNGNRLNIRNRPFDIEILNDMIDFYEQVEEFEKCVTIVNFKNNILDHENNYK
jgi:hypothetical protein